jgi:hypothetical protein
MSDPLGGRWGSRANHRRSSRLFTVNPVRLYLVFLGVNPISMVRAIEVKTGTQKHYNHIMHAGGFLLAVATNLYSTRWAEVRTVMRIVIVNVIVVSVA